MFGKSGQRHQVIRVYKDLHSSVGKGRGRKVTEKYHEFYFTQNQLMTVISLNYTQGQLHPRLKHSLNE